MAAWGDNQYGQTTVPLGLGRVKEITAGSSFSAALKVDGTVVVWGRNPSYDVIPDVPAGLSNVKAISAGMFHMLALRADGTVFAWGDNTLGQTSIPGGLSNVIAIAACADHNLALKADGTLIGWGNRDPALTNIPPDLTNVIAMAGGLVHNVALKVDGTLVAWGDNSNGQTNLSAGLSNIVAVAAGDYHSLALRGDGVVFAWGSNGYGQSAVPAGLSNVVAIAAGSDRSLAMKSDGTVVIWGGNLHGERSVPAGLLATAIAGGAYHNLALVSEGPVQIIQNPQSNVGTYSSNLTFSVSVAGYQSISFQWKLRGSNVMDDAHVSGSTNSTLTINSLQFSDAGNYSVVVSNALGSVQSLDATLFVISPPLVLQQSSNQTLKAGASVTLSANVLGTPTLSYQWLFGGTNIAGANLNSLTLFNMQPSMSGDYVLVISNAYGVAQSAPISLLVTDSAPYIVQQLTNKNATPGGSLSMAIKALGSLPLSYQWRFNGIDLPGATNSILTLDSVSYGQGGYYNVAVTNAFGEAVSAKALLSVSEMALWGGNLNATIPTNVPAGLSNLVAVAAGDYHVLALKADGTTVSWFAQYSQLGSLTNTPTNATNVIAISAGGLKSMALRTDGRVVVWGDNAYDQTSVPASLTNAVAIAAGSQHCMALRSNGTVVAWGYNGFGQTSVPAGLSNVVSIAAGRYSSMALMVDGRVVVWGGSSLERTVPNNVTNIVAIAGGQGLCVAVNADGRLMQWGQAVQNFPTGLSNVVAIANTGFMGIALRKDGTVVPWGQKVNSVPDGLVNVFAMAVGGYEGTFYVALTGDGRPVIKVQPFSQFLTRGTNVQLTAFAVGAQPKNLAGGIQPMTYQWQHDGIIVPGATNTTLRLTNVQGQDMGGYRLLVSNVVGQANSATAVLSTANPRTVAIAMNSTNSFTTFGPSNALSGIWFPQVRVSHDGDGAAQSGAITNNQQSMLQTTVVGPGKVTFWWKVSSEEGFDLLKFTLDPDGRTNFAAISGEVDWELETFSIPAGSHTLYWIYSKDASVSDGQDAGWVDQVLFTPDPIVITQQPVSQSVVLGTNVTFSVQATNTAALAYQWLKNGQNLSGATQTSLTLTNVTQADAGTYAVRVSNGAIIAFSSDAVLGFLLPQVLGSAASMPDRSFSFTSHYINGGPPGSNALGAFELQASSDLVTWIGLTNSPVITNGELRFVDTNGSNYARRFYRVVEKH